MGACKNCVKLKREILTFVNDHLPQLKNPHYSNGIVHDKEIIALRKYRYGSETEHNICEFYVRVRGYLPIKDWELNVVYLKCDS